jgi:hypothetical protein
VSWNSVLRIATVLGAVLMLVGLLNGGFGSSSSGWPRLFFYGGIAVGCGSGAIFRVRNPRIPPA